MVTLLEVFLSLLPYTFTLGFTNGSRIRPRISIKKEIYLKGLSGFCLLFILLASSSIQFFMSLSSDKSLLSDKSFQRKINFFEAVPGTSLQTAVQTNKEEGRTDTEEWTILVNLRGQVYYNISVTLVLQV